MNNFLLSEMFRLELKWKGVDYTESGICKLIGAYFTGPVLQVAQKLNEKDFMFLDFYSQYINLVKGTYVAKFSWEGIKYSDDGKTICLSNAFLIHEEELNNVPNLKLDDYFAIDTQDHVVEKHGRNLVYKTYLINSDSSLYRFENER